MSKQNRFKWYLPDNGDNSLVEEAERLSQRQDPPDPDYIYLENIDDVIDETEASIRGQPPPTVLPPNKRIRALHELCETIARNYCYLSINGEQLVRYIPELGCYQEDKPP